MATLTKMTRTTKKLEVPRPLKSTSGTIHTRNSVVDFKINSVDDLIVLTETVACELTHGNYDRCLQNNIGLMYQNLKLYGPQLDSIYKDLLDRFFVVFRNGSQDDNLDKRSRLHLLELIELRAKQWEETDHMSHYYKHRVTHSEPMLTAAAESTPMVDSTLSFVSPTSPIEAPAPLLLGPGEIIKTSGKFTKPTKIPGKNYSKDEVVIRNADSGKVMGIKGRRVHMIEELSDTIISFQRVSPGAKERLVQITGPNEENVNHAKHLIGDTIRRNASPVRLEGSNSGNLGDSTSSLNSSASEESGRPNLLPITPLSNTTRPLLHSFSTSDANLGEFRYTVSVGTHSLKITGDNLNIVNMAKLALDEFFENLNVLESPINEYGDVFSFNSRRSLNRIGSKDYNSNGSEDTLKANGLPSPTDDDVFIVKNSEENNVDTLRKPRFSRGSSYSDKSEGDKAISKLSYTYETLLHYSSSPLSKQVPKVNFPNEIVRKVSLNFNGEIYLQKVMEGRQSINSTSEETKDSPEPE